MRREGTKFLGVYERKGSGKREGDVAYDIVFRYRGKPRYKAVGWKSEGMSPRKAYDLRSQKVSAIRLNGSLPEETKPLLFKDAFKLYLEWCQTNKSKGGYDEGGRYRAHLEAPLAEKRLDEIDTLFLERLKTNLLNKKKSNGEPLSNATIRHLFQIVTQTFNKVIEWGKFSGSNPTRNIKMPKLDNRKERFLTPEEAKPLLTELRKKDKDAFDQVMLSIKTGMRHGEIFKLQGQHVDFKKGEIYIPKTKNGKARRVFMDETMRSILEGRIGKPDEFLFPGGQKAQKRVAWIFERTAKRLGLNKDDTDRKNKLTFHSTRHSFDSKLLEDGVHPLHMKNLMGHATLQMTDRYSHAETETLKQRALAAARAFEPEKEEEPVIDFESLDFNTALL